MKCRLEYPFDTPPIAGRLAVAGGLHWLRLPLPFALDHINLWLLEESETWTAVDTGVPIPPARAAWEEVCAGLLNARPIRRIVITHFHPDHYGLAAWLQQRFDAEVCITRAEQETASLLYAATDEQASQRVGDFYAAHGLDPARCKALVARGNFYRSLLSGMPTVGEYLADGAELRIGDRHWQIVTGQGHSPEHACLYCEAEGWLISGDQVLPGISSNISVRPEKPEEDPLAGYLHSLDRLRSLVPHDVLVLPSHGPVFRGLHERISALLRHHELRLRKLRKACREKPLSATEALPILFRRELDQHALFFAMGEAIAHLHRLWYAGDLIRYRDEQGIYRFAPR